MSNFQEKNFEHHRKYRRVWQCAVGAGPVSSLVLDHLLLLHLERCKVHREGRTIMCTCLDANSQLTLRLLKGAGSGNCYSLKKKRK